MKSFFTLSILILSNYAFPWGVTGHRVVGEIAQIHLSPTAKEKLKAILGDESLARIANWADEIKSDPKSYSHTFNWHYTDWPDEMVKHDEANSSGKLLAALDEQLKVLKNPKESEEKKVFALKVFVHLIGDLHQPLHVGNGKDRGGNDCQVDFHNKKINFHQLWDEEIINFTRLSFTEFAAFISQNKTPKEIESMKEGSFSDWALESKKLRKEIYPPHPEKYCSSKKKITKASRPKLSFEYSYRFLPVIEGRLFKAGVRLAHLLNTNL